jgi:hypothetical protein
MAYLFKVGSAIAFLLVLVPGRTAVAQTAWVDPAGSLGLSLDYTYSSSDKILAESGTDSAPVDPVQNHNFALSAEYVPIDKLAVELTIPMTSVRYSGDPEEGGFPRHGRYDDGSFHTTLTDLRLIARYSVLSGRLFALAPYLGVNFPLVEYETVGYAGVGRGLRQLPIGLAAGSFITDSLFAHANYEFTLSEKYDTGFDQTEVGQNRSDVNLLIGYFFFDGRLQVNAAGTYRVTHGGIDFAEADMVESPVLYTFHDPLLAESFMLAGGGASFQITDTLSVDALFRLFVTGEMTRNLNMFGGGLSWSVL